MRPSLLSAPEFPKKHLPPIEISDSFFANRANVPTRFVYCGTVQSNQLAYDGHSWTESFLQSQGRWIYSDPVKAIVGVFNHEGLALNTADVFQLCQ